jgi:hypothetical protein
MIYDQGNHGACALFPSRRPHFCRIWISGAVLVVFGQLATGSRSLYVGGCPRGPFRIGQNRSHLDSAADRNDDLDSLILFVWVVSRIEIVLLSGLLGQCPQRRDLFTLF